MIDTRTTKVLGALLVAMTLGALLLMAMESQPPRPSSETLASIRSSAAVGGVLLSPRWRRIVVHSSLGGADTLPQRCHFVVYAKPDEKGWQVRPTGLWRRQVAGHHVFVDGREFNSDSIGICLIGDFSTTGPDAGEFEALLGLIRSLQRKCGIRAENIYLASELTTSARPGLAFPVAEFNSRLGR
jgi:hypothetical protein